MDSNDSAIAPPIKQPHIARTEAFITGLVTSVLLCLTAPGLLILLIALLLDPAEIPKWWIAIAILAAMLAATVFFFRVTMTLRRETFAILQKDRDRFAGEVAACLRAGGTPPPYSLYLRPFFTDGHLTADEGFARTLSFDVNEIADFGLKRDIEAAAARALEDHAPLLSLGRPNDRLGAGRIETDDDNWRALFDLLIRHARRVIMVPIGQPATMEEVRRIAVSPDLLAKTVFVRPADRRNRGFHFAPDPAVKSIGAMWNWTRTQIADVLPHFPPFRGGARLVTFPEGEEAVEYRGNGLCTVQQPSAIRHFLVEGETRMADRLLGFTFWSTLALVGMGAIQIGVLDKYPVNEQEVAKAVGVQFLQIALAIPLLGIALYKLVTEDLPRRAALPVSLSLLGVFALSIATAVWMEPDMARADMLRINNRLSVFGYFANYFMIYIVAAYLTGRFVDWRHVLLLVVLAVVGVASAPQNLIDWQAGDAPDWIRPFSIAKSTLFQAVPMVLPLLAAVPRRRWPLLVGGALAMSGLTLIIWNLVVFPWHMAAIEARFREFRSFDLVAEYGWAWSLLWRQLAGSALTALPFLAWPFLARRLTGIGRRRRWAGPLEPPVS
jgi:hypothetical protein